MTQMSLSVGAHFSGKHVRGRWSDDPTPHAVIHLENDGGTYPSAVLFPRNREALVELYMVCEKLLDEHPEEWS